MKSWKPKFSKKFTCDYGMDNCDKDTRIFADGLDPIIVVHDDITSAQATKVKANIELVLAAPEMAMMLVEARDCIGRLWVELSEHNPSADAAERTRKCGDGIEVVMKRLGYVYDN